MTHDDGVSNLVFLHKIMEIFGEKVIVEFAALRRLTVVPLINGVNRKML